MSEDDDQRVARASEGTRSAGDQEPVHALLELLVQVESLLLLPAVDAELLRRNLDSRTILSVLDGVAAYLEGDKVMAVENLANAADVIVADLERSGVKGWVRS